MKKDNKDSLHFCHEQFGWNGRRGAGPRGLNVDDYGLAPSVYRAIMQGYTEYGMSPQEACDKLEAQLRRKLATIRRILGEEEKS